MSDPIARSTSTPKPPSSATMFLAGALIAIVGGVLMVIGQSQALTYATSSDFDPSSQPPDGTALLVVSGLVTIAGVGFVIGGIYRALQRIDLLHWAKVDAAARKAPDPERQ